MTGWKYQVNQKSQKCSLISLKVKIGMCGDFEMSQNKTTYTHNIQIHKRFWLAYSWALLFALFYTTRAKMSEYCISKIAAKINNFQMWICIASVLVSARCHSFTILHASHMHKHAPFWSVLRLIKHCRLQNEKNHNE